MKAKENVGKLGFNVTNDIFAENSWHFRNALVRANYNNRAKGVFETTKYLELILRNLLLGEDNILSNREMHVNYREVKEKTEEIATREDLIIEILKENPNITLQELADKIGESLRTVKTSFEVLQENGKIERVGGKKDGS